MKTASFRTLFALIETKELYIYQMNIVIVFLYNFLNKIIYVNQLDGFIKNLTLIYEFRKALYGHCQSLRV